MRYEKKSFETNLIKKILKHGELTTIIATLQNTVVFIQLPVNDTNDEIMDITFWILYHKECHCIVHNWCVRVN